MSNEEDLMNTTRRWLALALALLPVALGACHTDTAIGVNGFDAAIGGQGTGGSHPNDAGVVQGQDAGGGAGGTIVATGGRGGRAEPGTGGAAGGSAGSPSLTTGDGPFVNPADIQGSWTGYFENFTFPSGSDAIRLDFTKDAAGNDVLAVILGGGAPPPAPSDPTQSWPTAGLSLRSPRPGPIEGATYPAHEVQWTTRRLRFKLASNEPYGPWCALQTSYFVRDLQGYNCVLGGGGAASADRCWAEDDNGTTMIEVPCGQFLMCSRSYCTCDASGCLANPKHDWQFDITFGNGSGSGSAVLGAIHNLHLSPS